MALLRYAQYLEVGKRKPHPQPLSKGRGEWYALCIARLLLVNWVTRQLLYLSRIYFILSTF